MRWIDGGFRVAFPRKPCRRECFFAKVASTPQSQSCYYMPLPSSFLFFFTSSASVSFHSSSFQRCHFRRRQARQSFSVYVFCPLSPFKFACCFALLLSAPSLLHTCVSSFFFFSKATSCFTVTHEVCLRESLLSQVLLLLFCRAALTGAEAGSRRHVMPGHAACRRCHAVGQFRPCHSFLLFKISDSFQGHKAMYRPCQCQCYVMLNVMPNVMLPLCKFSKLPLAMLLLKLLSDETRARHARSAKEMKEVER